MGETPRKRKREEEPMASATPPKEVPARSQAPMGGRDSAKASSRPEVKGVKKEIPRQPNSIELQLATVRLTTFVLCRARATKA